METDKVDYTVNLDDLSWDVKMPDASFTINTSQFNGTSIASAGNFYYTNNTGITGIDYTEPGLQVKGDCDFEGDVKIKGKSILTMLETIEKRLAILQPDPEKLEHFEALQKAYEHYKTLESLCQLPKKEEK